MLLHERIDARVALKRRLDVLACDQRRASSAERLNQLTVPAKTEELDMEVILQLIQFGLSNIRKALIGILQPHPERVDRAGRHVIDGCG